MLAEEISKQTIFPHTLEQMYFYIRDPLSQNRVKQLRQSEGFCSEIEFYSELLDGGVFIDGNFQYNIGVGDTFKIDSKPEYRLKCIRFFI